MEENKQQQPVEEQEIDLLEIVRKLWDARLLIVKWCVIGAVVGLVVASEGIYDDRETGTRVTRE